MEFELIHLLIPASILAGGAAIALANVIKEMTEAIEKIKYFITKYKAFFMNGEGKNDFLELEKEIDQALEAVADLLDKFKMKKYSKKLREVIK